MTLPPLPASVSADDGRRWETFQPYYQELINRDLNGDNAGQWLADWSQLARTVTEAISLIYIAKSQDTADPTKEQAFLDYLANVDPQVEAAEEALRQRLLALNMDSADIPLVMRKMRNAADLYRDENIPLQIECAKLSNEYDKLTGAMTVEWEGETKNLSQLNPYLMSKEPAVREKAWNLMMEPWTAARATLNDIYRQMLEKRRQIAENAGFPDYRAYAFRQMERFEYTPEDCLVFHEAIEAVVVPAVQRILEKKKARLGLDRLRPWDYMPERRLIVETGDAPALKPYAQEEELIAATESILKQVDPILGGYFQTMAGAKLLDLMSRPGKALGGYCSTLPLRRQPFIFMNGVGVHDDLLTMTHEAGHAFHVFETAELPLIWQTEAPMEFCEVASMSMELLSAPYWTKAEGGFYTASEAARARIDHLEGILLFLPYMAVVDAFQHWVYTHMDEALSAEACDAAWDRLWQRFVPGVDWTGWEEARRSGWHRKPHIFDTPFYYIEYGLAQVGALQVWRNSLRNQAGTVAAYREALAEGGNKTLPELFQAAGIEFRFDKEMLQGLVELVEGTVKKLETEIGE
jgi:oligoendopeptidase F